MPIKGDRTPTADRVRARLVTTPGPLDTPCHLWTGALRRRGYGHVRHWNGERWANTGTHRVMWEEVNGPIPDDLCILHRCDTPACCNPEHMFLGDRADNLHDAIAKGRFAPPYGPPRQRDATGRFTGGASSAV